MTVTRQSLVEHFRLLRDEELLAQFQSGELTDLAEEVAGSELRGRNIDCSKPGAENLLAETSAENDAAVDTGDLELVARYATAAEAYMLLTKAAAISSASSIFARPTCSAIFSAQRIGRNEVARWWWGRRRGLATPH